MTEIQNPTPSDAFELLMAGNQRFVSGTPEHPNSTAKGC
jgi:carbonic anhydrase